MRQKIYYLLDCYRILLQFIWQKKLQCGFLFKTEGIFLSFRPPCFELSYTPL